MFLRKLTVIALPLALTLVLALVISATVNFFLSRPKPFVFADCNDYQGFEALICSVLLFLLLLNLDLSRCPRWLDAGIRRISLLSFSIYLFSHATDMLIYPYFQNQIPRRGVWFFAYALCALASLLLCIPLAWLAEALARPLIRWISKVLTRLFRLVAPD